jgi:hypothetical protein
MILKNNIIFSLFKESAFTYLQDQKLTVVSLAL